jgi:hypothetical protein
MQSVCAKSQVPVFFKETNSNHYLQLILTPLLRKLTKAEKMYNPHSLKEVKVNTQREFANFSGQQLHHALRNIFTDCQTCSEAGRWHF